MGIINKFINSIVLLSGCVTIAYGQNCGTLLQRATEAVSQKKYCEAKRYYQQYGKCNADADVSTEIAMCERYSRLQGEECDDSKDYNRDISSSYSPEEPVRQRAPNVQSSSAQGLSGFLVYGGISLTLPTTPNTITFDFGAKVYRRISSSNGFSYFGGLGASYTDVPKVMSTLDVPITAGINYAYAINNSFSIYGETAVGSKLSKSFMADSKAKDPDMISGFLWDLEAGVLLAGKFTISSKYSNVTYNKASGKGVSFALGFLF